MKKKGVMWNQILGAVITIVVIAVLVYLFLFRANIASASFNLLELQQSRNLCQKEMDDIPKPADNDDDDYPDYVVRLKYACDQCLNGDDGADNDKDGIPDDCDDDDENPYDRESTDDKKIPATPKKECDYVGGYWNEELRRCEI